MEEFIQLFATLAELLRQYGPFHVQTKAAESALRQVLPSALYLYYHDEDNEYYVGVN